MLIDLKERSKWLFEKNGIEGTKSQLRLKASTFMSLTRSRSASSSIRSGLSIILSVLALTFTACPFRCIRHMGVAFSTGSQQEQGTEEKPCLQASLVMGCLFLRFSV
ncbi:hypothetical protein H1230_16770 [Paenibacillus sp. 19GGS1-52]|uniref:hypothetical protein n=1 Tax=Paenibacillus sp. 19GGS1-52 TaxID=2758563 RepID=UPI001EFB68CE|nr:hypothetical protein [Paenibacillus sp. 19GGS1-52]ULO04802.1 hypothetical protein H1230_16770 [Paenibacillus sp. 19GGS1-52]